MPDVDRIVGYVTIKVPVEQLTDQGNWENPPETWLAYGEAELIEHDLKDEDLAWLGHEIDNGDVTCDFQFPPALSKLAEEAQERVQSAHPYPDNIFLTGGQP